jgi:hypothetical protein
MIKKRIAIMFVLIANFVLLAHIVMPHHHHEGNVFVLSSHCHQNDNSDDAANNADHKQHHGNHDNECCLLDQDIIIPSNQIRLENLSIDNNTSYYDFHFILESNKLEFYVPEYKRKIILLIRFSYAQIANISLGLRAPPIV